jgi:hypothetical protein
MNGEQISNQNIEPQKDHHELNYIVWILIVVILATGAWYFFFRVSDAEKQEIIAESKTAVSAEELLDALNEDYPVPKETSISSVGYDRDEEGNVSIGSFGYYAEGSKEETMQLWTEHASLNRWTSLFSEDNKLGFSRSNGEPITVIFIVEEDTGLVDVVVELEG